MDLAGYRDALDRSLTWAAEIDRLAPARLSYVTVAGAEEDGRARSRPVPESASLLCGCAAPGSPRRAHPCHLELLTPFLVLAGWDVVLWGRRVTACTDTWDGPEGGYYTAVIYDDDGQPFDATAYGWPEDPTT